MALREAVDEQDFRPIRISPVLCRYGEAIWRLYRDRLEFLLLSKAGCRESGIAPVETALRSWAAGLNAYAYS